MRLRAEREADAKGRKFQEINERKADISEAHENFTMEIRLMSTKIPFEDK